MKNSYDDANRRSFNSVRILGEELTVNEITVNGVSINPNNWEQNDTTKVKFNNLFIEYSFL